MNVSVIIPAHNAAGTLAETLESLRAQTFTGWEAIVVDDGSSDGTAALAASYQEKDPRIRTTSQPKMGVGIARNTGIRLARFDWLLFLDADDWIVPSHLERMTGVLLADPTLDAVHCGWVRIAPDGNRLFEGFCNREGDLFNLIAITCPFSIHACVIRRSIVVSLGGFDTSLTTCEDWDLWQRIARTGARFGAIREVLSLYRMRPGSASNNGFRLFIDGLRVIGRGHSSDPRVPNPRPENANGLPAVLLPTAMFTHMCWCSGIFLGLGKDARPLLNELSNIHDALIEPEVIASNIFLSSLIHACQPKNVCDKFWPNIEQCVEDFLFALEKKSQTIGLARRVNTALKHLIMDNSASKRPLTVGALHAVRVEITEPICDITPPEKVERLNCNIELEGKHIGMIELPVCDGIVPGPVLADAIAAEFSWIILSRFFERTIYPHLSIKREPTGLSIWRETVRLAESLPDEVNTVKQQLYERAGWTVFLQEIWGCKTLPLESFYTVNGTVPLKKIGWKALFRKLCARYVWPQAHPFETTTAQRNSLNEEWIIVEVSENLPNVKVSGQILNVVFTVGGAVIGIVAISAKANMVSDKELRAALTTASGIELCCAAVREGLLGRPITGEPLSLRDRLAAVKSSAMKRYENYPALKAYPDIVLVLSSVPAFHCVLSTQGIIFGRHVHGGIGTSASRRAMLPAATIPELIDAASVAGEPVIQVSAPNERPQRVIYAPELVWLTSRRIQPFDSGSKISHIVPSTDSNISRQNIENIVTDRLPILMYHRVAPTGKPTTARYRVTPESFEEQLRYLRDAGYYSVSLEDWHTAMRKKRPLPGRAVLITFDDGYLDFLTYAWPLLKRYGFLATVFIVADHVGGTNSWDSAYGEEIPLLGWEDIRQLQDEGVVFGSHSVSHPCLTALSPEKIVREGARSRAILGRELGLTVKAFAYPYGDVDQVVQHLIGACGYIFGLSCRHDLSGFHDPLLALPRLEVFGADSLQNFVAKLSICQKQDIG